MMRTMMMAFCVLLLAGCSERQGTQLVSDDERHMLYVYLEDMEAEMYGGISMMASFDLKQVKENAYAFTPTSGDVGVVGFIHYPEKNLWRCPTCPKYGLSASWKEM